MLYTIKKGHQFASKMWLRFPLVFGDVMEREVVYHESCAYDLKSRDQEDWNKTFGRSFSLNPKKHSVRYGNRYNLESQLVEIGYYFHVNFKKIHGRISDRSLERPIHQRLETTNVNGFVRARFILTYTNGLQRTYIRQTDIPYRCIGWKLYPFFGGDRFAPHNIYISLINPNNFMRQTLDSIFKHWFMSLVFLVIAPIIIALVIYSERVNWPVEYQWAKGNYWFVLLPILAHLFITLPLLRRAENKNKGIYRNS